MSYDVAYLGTRQKTANVVYTLDAKAADQTKWKICLSHESKVLYLCHAVFYTISPPRQQSGIESLPFESYPGTHGKHGG